MKVERRRHSRDRSKDRRKHRRPHSAVDEESYEDLARKKKRIESELHQLDLQEAKEKKRAEKAINEEKRSKSESHKRKHPVVKKEPSSDEEDAKRRRRRKEDKEDKDAKDNKKKPAEGKSKDNDNAKPDFSTSGKLAEDTNMYNGVVIKYNEPSEARKPKRRWRLYPFKGDTELPFLPVHRQSAYLFGRSRLVADVPIDHPSCSKQHAVLQFRIVPFKRPDGSTGRKVRPYIIDLDSANGTFLNNNKIEPRKYVELIEKDVLKFGFSSRDWVVLHEESKEEENDDDVKEEENEED